MTIETPKKIVRFPSKTEQDAIRLVDDHLGYTGLSVERLYQFAFWFNETPRAFRDAFVNEARKRALEERT
jgi:hypothetical protein